MKRNGRVVTQGKIKEKNKKKTKKKERFEDCNRIFKEQKKKRSQDQADFSSLSYFLVFIYLWECI